METPVEIRYAGVVIARANEVRRMTVGGVDMFLAMPEPLPAGTVVSLNNGTQARVEKVIESTDPSIAGIYVKLLNDGEATQPWVPCFREDEVPAPRPPAVVVSPVIVRPVHRAPTPIEGTSRPEPMRVEAPPPPPRAEPVVVRREEPPVTVVPEPVPTVETIAEPPKAFTASMPRPGEQIAHFDAHEPPPAVVEGPIKRERSKRSTIVVAIPPPADPDDERSEGVVKRAAGEIDTGSRRIQNAQAEVQSASIVVEPEPHEPPAAAAPETEPEPESPKQAELKLEDLATAKPLPPARGRATKRRKTQIR
jgi:hypothetical protein